MTPKPSLYRIERAGPRGVSASGESRPPADAILTYSRRRWPITQPNADIGTLREAIATATREIGAIGAHGMKPNAMTSARGELAAIAAGTADATAAILAAVEAIEARASMPCASACAAELGMIRGQVTAVYEACTFQDIAGQRIAKLVRALGFLEERLARAATALNDVETAREEAAGTNARKRPNGDGGSLVNGPRAPGAEGHVSQADIDQLFA